jgi:hypothetical protein
VMIDFIPVNVPQIGNMKQVCYKFRTIAHFTIPF